MIPKELQEVTVNFEGTPADGGYWMQPFNQVTFFNYDTTNPVFINDVMQIAAASVEAVTLRVIPTLFEISLNAGEVNVTNYKFNFKGSTSQKMIIVYTQYKGVE